MAAQDNKRLLHLSLIVILSTTPPVRCQIQMSRGAGSQSRSAKAEEVLTKFLQAVGDVTAGDSVETSVSEGNIVDWEGQRIQVEDYWKSPDKRLMIEHRSRAEIRRGSDGKTRWTQEGNGKPKRVKLSYDQENDVSFEDVLHWRDKLKKADFAGEADVLGAKAFVLNVAGDRPAALYFDQQTGLLLRQDTKWEQSQVETYYFNYVETSGVKVPWRVEFVYLRTGKKYVRTITKVTTNVPLDDAMFAMPTR